jgi:hypothetical protein
LVAHGWLGDDFDEVDGVEGQAEDLGGVLVEEVLGVRPCSLDRWA